MKAKEQNHNLNEDFLTQLSAPARRALENQNITTLENLAKYSEKEILKLHGVGKTTIPLLKEALKSAELHFRE